MYYRYIISVLWLNPAHLCNKINNENNKRRSHINIWLRCYDVQQFCNIYTYVYIIYNHYNGNKPRRALVCALKYVYTIVLYRSVECSTQRARCCSHEYIIPSKIGQDVSISSMFVLACKRIAEKVELIPPLCLT